MLTDTVPAGVGYVAGTLTATAGATDDGLAPTLTWTGSLSPSGTVTISYALTVTAVIPATITNTCTIEAVPHTTITRTATVLANWSTVHLPQVVREEWRSRGWGVRPRPALKPAGTEKACATL